MFILHQEKKKKIHINQFAPAIGVAANANGPLTIVWDDGPGHGRGVDASDHPEHAQPAQMLSSLLSGQHLRKVGEHDGNRSADPNFRENMHVFIGVRDGKIFANICRIDLKRQKVIWEKK